MDVTCPECGQTFHREVRPGRPRVYDQESCRRAAEQHKRERFYRLGKAVESAMKNLV